jgi:hypothetical protein
MPYGTAYRGPVAGRRIERADTEAVVNPEYEIALGFLKTKGHAVREFAPGDGTCRVDDVDRAAREIIQLARLFRDWSDYLRQAQRPRPTDPLR